MDNKYFSLGNKVIAFFAFIYLISGNILQLKNDIYKNFELDLTNDPEKENNNNNNTIINKFFSKINIYLNILAIVFIINIIIYTIQKNVIEINELRNLNNIIQTNLKSSFESTIFSFNISIFMLVFPYSSIFLIIAMLLYIRICKLTISDKLTSIFDLDKLLSNISNNLTNTKSNKLNYYIYGLLFVVILSNIFISNYPNFYYKYYLIYIFVIVIFSLISLILYKFRNIEKKCNILFGNKTLEVTNNNNNIS